MTYAVQQDLIDRFGADELVQLTDRANPPTGQIDTTVVARALTDADEMVNSYVAKRYDLPLASVPGLVKRLACDTARYFLHGQSATEQVVKAHDQAIEQLKDIAAGRAVLDIAGAEPAPAGATVEISAPERVFSNDTLRDF